MAKMRGRGEKREGIRRETGQIQKWRRGKEKRKRGKSGRKNTKGGQIIWRREKRRNGREH